MEEIKLKGDIVTIKSDQESKTSKVNESNVEDNEQNLKDIFNEGDRSGFQKIKTTGESKK